jgi:hypothetical protein
MRWDIRTDTYERDSDQTQMHRNTEESQNAIEGNCFGYVLYNVSDQDLGDPSENYRDKEQCVKINFPEGVRR